jgi:hypothetical protein
VTELRAYLGLLNFYRDFIPNISQKLKPLNELLNVAKGNETGFAQRWSKQCESCFQESKNWLLSRNLLIHYDESKPIVLYTDASPYGVGSVLCHLVDGTEKPVMYHSMSLSPSQQRYSQLVREAFAVKVAVTALHKYLYGKKFKIVTDNLPLKNLISPNKGLPVVASPRIQSWAVALQAYSYEVEYRKSSLLAPADALSRLPRDEIAEEKVWEVCHIDVFEDLPLSALVVAESTASDPILLKVKDCTVSGWSDVLSDLVLKPYFHIRHSLSVEEGCLLTGSKVIIPQSLRNGVLDLLHKGHPGICRMKMLARNCVWWPGIDDDIKGKVQDCEPCSMVNFRPASNVTISWPKAQHPWQRVHLDFFQYKSDLYLLLIDSYSLWLDVWLVPSTKFDHVECCLLGHISVFGYFDQVVTDNGPPFDSIAFERFCTERGIIVTKSPPYHPQSNGLAEGFVKISKHYLQKVDLAKDALKQINEECEKERSSQRKERLIAGFLFSYRNTPSVTTGLSPADMILKAPPRTALSMLKPNRGKTPTVPVFKEGDTVWVRMRRSEFPQKVEIVKVVSPLAFYVLVNGSMKLCHLNQVKLSHVPVSVEQRTPVHVPATNFKPSDECDSGSSLLPPQHVAPRIATPVETPVFQESPSVIVQRKSERIRRSPQRLNL